jgi:hypothetical protein
MLADDGTILSFIQIPADNQVHAPSSAESEYFPSAEHLQTGELGLSPEN